MITTKKFITRTIKTFNEEEMFDVVKKIQTVYISGKKCIKVFKHSLSDNNVVIDILKDDYVNRFNNRIHGWVVKEVPFEEYMVPSRGLIPKIVSRDLTEEELNYLP